MAATGHSFFLIGRFLKIFFSANQKQELSVVAMFVNGSELNQQTL
jgi:hypothetical protein